MHILKLLGPVLAAKAFLSSTRPPDAADAGKREQIEQVNKGRQDQEQNGPEEFVTHTSRRRAATDHNEHQVSQPSESLVLPKGLHQGGDVLLGVRAAHGQYGWLVGVPQVLTDLLQYQTRSNSLHSNPGHYNDIPNLFLTCNFSRIGACTRLGHNQRVALPTGLQLLCSG